MQKAKKSRAETAIEGPFSAQGACDVAWTLYHVHRSHVWRLAAILRSFRLVLFFGFFVLLVPVALERDLVTIDFVPIGILAFLLSSTLLPAETMLWLLVARDEEPAAGRLLPTLRHAPAMAVVGLIDLLLAPFGLLPGLYFSIRLRFARHLVVDRRMGPIAAFQESHRLTAGQSWRLFWFGFHDALRNQARSNLLGPANALDRSFSRNVAEAVLYLYLSGQASEDLLAKIDPRIEPAPGDPRPARKKTSKKAKPKGNPSFECPRCGGGVFERRREEHIIHRCTDCGGVWVDNPTSRIVVSMVDEALLKSSDEAASMAERPGADERPSLACPMCKKPLTRVPAAAIPVDFCPEHGTWFDRGELRRVTKAMELERAAKDYKLRDPTAGETLVRGAGAIGSGIAQSILAMMISTDDD